MEKTIKIKIDNKGKVRGTSKWLLENADHIKIGQTKENNQGAWLKDKDDKTLSCLAIRDWHDDGKIAMAIIMAYHGYFLCPKFMVSNACLAILQELAKKAIEIMEEVWNDNPPHDLKLTTT